MKSELSPASNPAEPIPWSDTLSLAVADDGWLLSHGTRTLAVNEVAARVAAELGAQHDPRSVPRELEATPGSCALIRQFLAFYFFDSGSLSPVVDYGRLVLPGPWPTAPSAPNSVSLLLTKLCNMHCLHCYNDSGKRHPRELSAGQHLALADYLGRWGVRQVTFTGGEPLLHLDLEPMIRSLVGRGVQVKVSTNGWFLGEEFLQLVASGGVHQVNVSLDGATPRLHDEYRGLPGSYDRALTGLVSLKRAGVQVLTLNVSVYDRNLGEMDQVCQLAGEFGVDAVSFKPILVSGRPTVPAWALLPRERLPEFRAARDRLKGRYPALTIGAQIIGSGVAREEEDDADCSAGQDSMFIDSNGDLLPCETLRPFFQVPNLRTSSPAEAWLGRELFWQYRDLKTRLRSTFMTGTTGCPAAGFGRGELSGSPDAFRYRGEPLTGWPGCAP